MNPILVACLAAAALAVLPSESVREVLATASGILFESTPFILAAVVIERIALGRVPWLVPLLGCGCGSGPAARSLPALAGTAVVFGPWIAGARWAAAMVAGQLLGSKHGCREEPASPLDGITTLLPAAIIAGIAAHLIALLGALPQGPGGLVAGAVAGFVLAPCGLGVAGIGGALRAVSPASAIGFLCIAGIADLRTFVSRHVHAGSSHDGGAYALLALLCTAVAIRGGATLVHPRFAIPLACCAIVFALLAVRHRDKRAARAWIAPAIMSTTIVFGAPAPPYHATATSLADAFAGEPIDFTGVLVRNAGVTAITRYAITCCRADAAPVTVRLDRDVRFESGAWIEAHGTLVASDDALRLHATRVDAVRPPADPFLYR